MQHVVRRYMQACLSLELTERIYVSWCFRQTQLLSASRFLFPSPDTNVSCFSHGVWRYRPMNPLCSAQTEVPNRDACACHHPAILSHYRPFEPTDNSICGVQSHDDDRKYWLHVCAMLSPMLASLSVLWYHNRLLMYDADIVYLVFFSCSTRPCPRPGTYTSILLYASASPRASCRGAIYIRIPFSNVITVTESERVLGRTDTHSSTGFRLAGCDSYRSLQELCRALYPHNASSYRSVHHAARLPHALTQRWSRIYTRQVQLLLTHWFRSQPTHALATSKMLSCTRCTGTVA